MSRGANGSVRSLDRTGFGYQVSLIEGRVDFVDKARRSLSLVGLQLEHGKGNQYVTQLAAHFAAIA